MMSIYTRFSIYNDLSFNFAINIYLYLFCSNYYSSKLGLEYFGFQIGTTYGLFLFVKTPIKSIFIYGLFNGGTILVL